MRSFRDKIALITGAGSGIGRALALQLAEAGTHLFLVDIDSDSLRDVVAQAQQHNVRVVGWTCDLAAGLECLKGISSAAIHKFGTVDILINNAGVCFYGPTTKMTDAQWDRIMAVNLTAPISLTRYLLPTLISRPDAHVVNISSICSFVAGGRYAAYTVSKFGLRGFSEALRAEFGRQGLGVTCVCPGPISTNLFRSGESAKAGRSVPQPPNWLCAKPKTVAKKTLKAMLRDRRIVLVTPLAYLIYYMNRWAPWMFDFLNRFGRRKRLKVKMAADMPTNRSQEAA